VNIHSRILKAMKTEPVVSAPCRSGRELLIKPVDTAAERTPLSSSMKSRTTKPLNHIPLNSFIWRNWSDDE